MRRMVVSLAAAALIVVGAGVGTAIASERSSVSIGGLDLTGNAVLKNVASGQCLDQDYTGGVPHSLITAYNCHKGDNQRWSVDLSGSSALEITLKNVKSGQCLDQDYSGGVPHSRVTAYRCHGGDNQKWEPQVVNGALVLQNVASGQCVDQDYTGGVPHSLITAYNCHNNTNQRWQFLP